MFEPQIFYFHTKRARAIRVGLFVLIGILLTIPVVALATGQDSYTTAAALLLALLMLLALWDYLKWTIQPCFLTGPNGDIGVALEIHADHLVLARPEGMQKIPKQHVIAIKGPNHNSWTNAPSTMGPWTQVVLDVPPEYKEKHWPGYLANPSVNLSMIDSRSEWDLMSALMSWHASP